MTVGSRASALLTLLSLGPLFSAPPEASRIAHGTLNLATAAEFETRSEILKVRPSGMQQGSQPASVTDPVGARLKPGVPGSEIVVDPAGPIRTLGAALLMSRPHGRIRVRPGTYREARILVQQPVTIEGEGWPRFIGADHEVMTVTADSVTIRGLIISDVAATAAEDRAGIRFSGVPGLYGGEYPAVGDLLRDLPRSILRLPDSG